MGAVGAVAPTIFSQWVQAMYSAPTIYFGTKTLLLLKHRRNLMAKNVRHTRVNIAVKIMRKHVKSIRYRFCYQVHSFMLPTALCRTQGGGPGGPGPPLET